MAAANPDTKSKNQTYLSSTSVYAPTIPPLRKMVRGELNQSYPSVKEQLQAKAKLSQKTIGTNLIFDLPLTYNRKVSHWISYFQDRGKVWFRDWLEKSSVYMPFIQKELKINGLPQDLAYMVMIESGFEPNAISHASAVGPWQFIQPTGERYGLTVRWWLDERRDLKKSTQAAIRYLKDLYAEFGSWYLVAASYNMGEGGLRRQVKKHKTRDFWALAQAGALPQETTDYVPKILAAMLISKSPGLYGFRNLAVHAAYEYDIISAPKGTDLKDIANHLGVTHKAIKDLNAELLLGYIPRQVDKHFIRVPKGSASYVAEYIDLLNSGRVSLNGHLAPDDKTYR